MENSRTINDDIDIITADETLQEYDIGEPPIDDEEMEDIEDMHDIDQDNDDRIVPEQADIQDDAEMVFDRHGSPVYAISIHPIDSRIILTGGGDDTGILWHRESGAVIHRFNGHTDSVVAVGFSFDGKYAATGGYDGIVKIWDVTNGQLVHSLEGPSQEIEWLTWHSKGAVILAGSQDGTIWMWLASTGECMHVFAGHEDGVTCGSFTGSGKMIVTGSNDMTVRFWNPKTGECNHVFRGHGFHEAPITFLTCHPNQPLVLTGSQDGTARLLQLQSKRILATFSHEPSNTRSGTIDEEDEVTVNSVECGGFCNVMNWAATGCLGGFVRVWDLSTNQCRHVCQHPAGVTKLLWHPTQAIIFSCTVEGLVYIWDARNGALLKTLAGHTDMILDLAYISQGGIDYLMTASDDESARCFKVST